MNKKFTPKLIKQICIEALVVIIAVTAVGGAVITHQQYKSNKSPESDSAVSDSSTTEEPDGTSEVNTTNQSTTNSTQNNESTTSKNEATVNNSDFPYAYAGFTPKITDVNVDLSKFIVNGKYALPEGYKPTLAEAVKGSGVQLDYRVAPYYQAMYDAAKKDGITLTPISGYRSYERQKNNFENRIKQYMNEGMDKTEATKKAAEIIMIPGSSEHNAGLAMDICSLSESFENTDEFAWLNEHAADYGFILRYPKAAEKREITGVTYEPWHYRYVGVEAAKDIKSRGITLEEYLGLN
ncbi:MAG: M15 family metallopeptidase [Clostridia bacterium]|nr:M15 family metallopeptidase [Clostridia bacterium]